MDKSKPPFVKRVVLKNFKSFKHCDVELGPLTILVGPNGSGKSNFLDALDFVSNFLRGSMQERSNARQLLSSPVYLGEGDAIGFSIELTLVLPDGRLAYYGLRIATDPCEYGDLNFAEENCRIEKGDSTDAEYRVEHGKVVSHSFELVPSLSPGRPYLTVVSGYPDFRLLYESLSGMRFYDIIPNEVRELPSICDLSVLSSNGFGMSISLNYMSKHHPDIIDRITEYLRAFVPSFKRIILNSLVVSGKNANTDSSKQYNLLAFEFAAKYGPLTLPPECISDGTLRALGILTALYQCLLRPDNYPIPLVAIEEPETSLHPAAVAVLMDAMHEASGFTQVIATTQSPELLDNLDLESDVLLITDMGDEGTVITPVDEASRSIVRDGLFTPGELLKQSQLMPQNNSTISVQDSM